MFLVKYVFSHRCTNKLEISTDFHSHNLWQFLYLYKGSADLFFEKRKYVLGSGGLLLIRPGVLHKLVFPPPETEMCDTLQMKLYIADDIIHSFPWLAEKPYFIFNCLSCAIEIESCLDLMNRQGIYNNEESGHALEGLVVFLYAKLSALHSSNFFKKGNPDPRIITILNYINSNTDKNFTTRQLAEMVSLEESYFIRIFGRQTGMSPKTYINRKKMENARNLLILTSSRLHEIARESGFNNYHYFSRLFRKIWKCSPQEYRAKKLN